MTAWQWLPRSSGDAWQRMCGDSGNAWQRLAGAAGDAWERLIVNCGGSYSHFAAFMILWGKETGSDYEGGERGRVL